MEKIIILQGITFETLLENIDSIVEKRLKEKVQELNPKIVKYLNRKEVKDILKVSLVTISAWTKNGYLTSYRIGSRIFYKSDEVDLALTKRKFERR